MKVKVVSIFITIEQNVIYVNYVSLRLLVVSFICIKDGTSMLGKLKIYKIYL